MIPWSDEIFAYEFSDEPVTDNESTRGWSAAQFARELRRLSGILTIAMEPDYCGGWVNAEYILGMVNRYVLADTLYPCR